MSDFKWWVPRRFREWIITKPKKRGASENLFTCSPAGWCVSQHKGRRNALQGFETIYRREYASGRLVIEGRGGWTYYGGGPVEFDSDFWGNVRK